MSRIAYVNGAYVQKHDAAVHIEDRAHQFGDGVYEGVTIYKGALIDLEPHLDRLWRSMDALAIPAPMMRGPMRFVLGELVRRNHIDTGFLYLQVSRGSAPRDHAFPTHSVPSFTATCKMSNLATIKRDAKNGVNAISQPDIRWGRCDVKTTNLLPNALAKQAAKVANCYEAVLIDENGNVTEGSSTNIWLVGKDGKIRTRPIADNILPGITRMMVMTIAANLKYTCLNTSFSLDEAYAGAELFLTSSSAGPLPIVTLDGEKINGGKVGPVTAAVINAYTAHLDAQARP